MAAKRWTAAATRHGKAQPAPNTSSADTPPERSMIASRASHLLRASGTTPPPPHNGRVDQNWLPPNFRRRQDQTNRDRELVTRHSLHDAARQNRPRHVVAAPLT